MDTKQLAQLLTDHRDSIAKAKVVTGFDAFVDEMILVVDKRNSLDSFDRVETIGRLGELISASAGHSSLREIVIQKADPGGCAINMGDGLVALGVPVETFATIGEPPHKVFADYASKAKLHSWGREPGRTYAYEFADGKLMFSSVSQFAEFTPEDVARRLGDDQFQRACQQASLIALTDWSLYPHMTACWKLLQEQVFATLKHKPHIFLDLVDPSSRSDADILAMLEALRDFEICGQTTLGLNQNEANILARLTQCHCRKATTCTEAQQQAAELREAIGINEIVIHARQYATVADSSGAYSGRGPYCEKPLKSTGAGDRFNAGYALALLLDLAPVERIALATATSGLYVRTGHSPNLDELIAFLRQW